MEDADVHVEAPQERDLVPAGPTRVKQSVVGALGVNRRQEDESGVGRAQYSQ